MPCAGDPDTRSDESFVFISIIDVMQREASLLSISVAVA
jgi:hypothetical protein